MYSTVQNFSVATKLLVSFMEQTLVEILLEILNSLIEFVSLYSKTLRVQ